MNKLPKEKRDRLILVAMAAGGIIAALYLFVIGAQQRALADCSAKAATAKEKLAKAELWLRMAPTVRARLAACRTELESRHENMVPLDKFKWFYNTLEGFIGPRPVKLVDITREPEVGDVGVLPKFPYQAAIFGVKLQARYQDFGGFLAGFENEFPYMRVQNLELESDSAVKSAVGKEGQVSGSAPATDETLGITLRVVTLLKPGTPL